MGGLSGYLGSDLRKWLQSSRRVRSWRRRQVPRIWLIRAALSETSPMILGSGSASKLLWVATGRHESYTLKFPHRLQPRTRHVRNRYFLASITDWKDRGLKSLPRLSNLLIPCRVSTSHRSFSPSTTYTRKPLLQSQDGLPKPPRPSASTSKRKTKNSRS